MSTHKIFNSKVIKWDIFYFVLLLLGILFIVLMAIIFNLSLIDLISLTIPIIITLIIITLFTLVFISDSPLFIEVNEKLLTLTYYYGKKKVLQIDLDEINSISEDKQNGIDMLIILKNNKKQKIKFMSEKAFTTIEKIIYSK